MDIELLNSLNTYGFPTAVSCFLLWKGYQQDQRFIEALEQLNNKLDSHVKQKDQTLTLIEATILQNKKQ